MKNKNEYMPWHEDPETKQVIHKDKVKQYVMECAKAQKCPVDFIDIYEGKNGLNKFMMAIWAPCTGKYKRGSVAVPSDRNKPEFSRKLIRQAIGRLNEFRAESAKSGMKGRNIQVPGNPFLPSLN